MSDYISTQPLPLNASPLDTPAGPGRKRMLVLFITLLLAGCIYAGFSVLNDVSNSGAEFTSYVPFVLLGVALLVALGFEFVNGFHDTANAVATVIYTHSLPPTVAVVWSGVFNFLGVLLSSGAVAFGIISLLPVELILQAGSSNSFAMIYALLFSAILWNLGTWWLGLPASSSHTLIGSIIGVGVANAMLHGRSAASGVNWGQAMNIGYSLIVSPVVGFVCAAVLLLLVKKFIKNKKLHQTPTGNTPPPVWIRGLMILTCTGVSFAHGSNDGQKGMGLIMLILVATLPVTYSLNRAQPETDLPQLALRVSTQLQTASAVQQPEAVLTTYLRNGMRTADVLPAIGQVAGRVGNEVRLAGSLDNVPAERVTGLRNAMFLTSESIKRLQSDKSVMLSPDLLALKSALTTTTQFIPDWVKIVVAMALGLGTMVGWRRIVATLGEKIGKSHLNYAQGASAELVAMGTIGAADMFGLPVSTTHVLSSGIAGTMAANRSGLQMQTLRNMVLAWVLTLPAAAILSAALYWLLETL